MSNHSPILTIGIPTWNRMNTLGPCIDRIADQIRAVGSDIEVYISDNASTDGTQDVIAQYAAQLPILRYSRNRTNIGADRNFLEIFKKASGQYVWLFSDDDLLAPEAIHSVLAIIATHRPSFITTNYSRCDSQHRVIPEKVLEAHSIMADRANMGLDAVFKARNHWLSFMSCNIYRRDLLDISDVERNLDSVLHWVQVYMAAQVLSAHQNGFLSSRFTVLQRVDNNRLSSDVFVKSMPSAFNFIARRFKMRDDVRRELLDGIRTTFLSFKAYVVHRIDGTEIDELLVPWYYKIADLLPRSFWNLVVEERRKARKVTVTTS